jgi:hypothetical protein
MRLKSPEKFFADFKSHVLNFVFKDKDTGKFFSKPAYPDYCYAPFYVQYWQVLYDIISFCDMLGITYLDASKHILLDAVVCLNQPESIATKEDFEYYVKMIRGIFKRVEKKLQEKIALLNKEEYDRLNEALNCYIQGCNYSTIAMSVSAIEYRLFSLMKSKCPDSELEELTLGQLIKEYLDNKEKYFNVIPKKHEPLLNHCNVYRIFSVHPKREKITRAIATSIISMTFSFLLDENLKS